jgi:glycosyltransferase involved in cell wall biosynthesis
MDMSALNPPAPVRGVTLSVGPGHHGDRLAEALRGIGALRRLIRSWPDFAVEDYDCRSGRLVHRELYRAYRPCVRLSWALWRRLPIVGRTEGMRAPQYAFFDRLAARRLPDSDLFVGWTQLSLHSLRRARAAGRRTLLEHPMAHVRAMMALLEDEYSRFPLGRGGGYSRYPGRLIDRMCAEYEVADHISVLSSYAEETFVQTGIDRRRLVRLPLGVDPVRFAPRPGGRREGPLRVLYVGRLEILKGLQYLLPAWERLGRRDAELLLLGPVLPEMAPVLKRAGRNVRLLGEQGPAELARHYQAADVFVFPSLCDAFGLVLLEAMACGLPVIATRNSGGTDLIRDGESGYLVPIRDVDALAGRLAVLLSQPALRRAMGQAARETVLGGYTWAHYQERVAEAYAVLLS